MIMSRTAFEAYTEAFSGADDKSVLFDRYYHPEITFRHPIKGTFSGQEELVGFWNSGAGEGHDGVRERLHLKTFLSGEDKVAVELDIEWRCFKDTEYLGPRKKGEVFWGQCAAFYELKDGRFFEVQLYLNPLK
ncbi:MAG: nuclear transport factor 2 family protein [Alphaproteobacteria bacterium]|nr:nuclear transport factor 2 family protein [Alphaproteobacteria bacterium]MDP6813216.1 nuclear transport factor 2 family protein [Alphaproteobacteria bacterium]